MEKRWRLWYIIYHSGAKTTTFCPSPSLASTNPLSQMSLPWGSRRSYPHPSFKWGPLSGDQNLGLPIREHLSSWFSCSALTVSPCCVLAPGTAQLAGCQEGAWPSEEGSQPRLGVLRWISMAEAGKGSCQERAGCRQWWAQPLRWAVAWAWATWVVRLLWHSEQTSKTAQGWTQETHGRLGIGARCGKLRMRWSQESSAPIPGHLLLVEMTIQLLCPFFN